MVANEADDISNYRFMNPQNRKESYMSEQNLPTNQGSED